MKWKSTALGEVMRHRKGSITIDDTTTYKLCRVQVHRRGVVLRQELSGAGISTKKQQVCKAGDFLVAEMDAKVGGYGFVPAELDGAIVSSHYYLFEVEAKKLHPEYLEVVSQAEILQQQIVAKGSTNYSSIRPGSVLEWQIPLPEDLKVQKQIAQNFRVIQSKLTAVGEEITHQQSLLAKLKQAILQEAIQGKLTADWRAAHPDIEPASQLLHRIQAERARLIATKKLRPEKPLPKITPAEIPFEIPKGWEWCRLVDLGYIGTGATPATENKTYYENGQVPWITSSATGLPYVREAETFITEKALTETNCTVYPKHTLLVAMYGQGKTRGQVTELLIDAATNQACAAIVIPEQFIQTNHFTKLVIRENYHHIRELAQGGSQPNLNLSKIKSSLVPLPPLAEQAAIVERVEALMTTCRALEAEIAAARTHAAHLLQAVLKEAFAPATK